MVAARNHLSTTMTAKCYPSAHRQSTNCCHFIQPFSQIQAFHCRQQNRPTMLLLLPGLHYQHCCCNCFSIFCLLKANHSGITCDILYNNMPNMDSAKPAALRRVGTWCHCYFGFVWLIFFQHISDAENLKKTEELIRSFVSLVV